MSQAYKQLSIFNTRRRAIANLTLLEKLDYILNQLQYFRINDFVNPKQYDGLTTYLLKESNVCYREYFETYFVDLFHQNEGKQSNIKERKKTDRYLNEYFKMNAGLNKNAPTWAEIRRSIIDNYLSMVNLRVVQA